MLCLPAASRGGICLEQSNNHAQKRLTNIFEYDIIMTANALLPVQPDQSTRAADIHNGGICYEKTGYAQRF
jgi:hypothetical protein